MLTDINWNEKLCNFDDVDDMCEEFSKNFPSNLKCMYPFKSNIDTRKRQTMVQ